MKKIIFTIITSALACGSALAQIPNNSFENWTSMGSYSNPDSWDNLNNMTSAMSVYTATKGVGGATGGGTAYLKLVSKNVSGMGVMPGLAVSGLIDIANLQAKSGFAFSQQPASLSGSWQYMASGADEGFIAVYLTKWNNSMMMRDTIATAYQNLSGMAMSWSPFNISLSYASTVAPDSAMIILSASGANPVANSYLYIDNLSFTGSAVGIDKTNTINSTVAVYPNPSKESMSVVLENNTPTNCTLQLMDAKSEVVREVQMTCAVGKSNVSINTTGLTKGIYFLKLIANGRVEAKKVVIE